MNREQETYIKEKFSNLETSIFLHMNNKVLIVYITLVVVTFMATEADGYNNILQVNDLSLHDSIACSVLDDSIEYDTLIYDSTFDDYNPILLDKEVFSSERRIVCSGLRTTIPVYMSFEKRIMMFQFELSLPKGVKAAMSEDGNVMVEFPEELKSCKHFSHYDEDSRILQIGCESTDDNELPMLDGFIMYVTLTIDESLKEGNHTIWLQDISLIDKEKNRYIPNGVRTVMKFIPFSNIIN